MAQRLSSRQKRFVQEFLTDGNASAAAIRAGYSQRAAKQVAHRLMRLPHVQEAIAQGQALVQERAEDSAERVVRDLLRACEGAAEDRDWRGLGKLMELRCKVQGMLRDRVEVTGRDGGAIVHDLARRVVEDAGAASLAHELLERVAGVDPGRPRMAPLRGGLGPGPAPAPAEQAPD